MVLDHIQVSSHKRNKHDTQSNEITEIIKSSSIPINSNIQSNQRTRIWLLVACIVVLFLLIGTRLLELQIVRGAQYAALADKNKTLKKTILAPRGIIKDRNNEIIAFNKPFIEKDGQLTSFTDTASNGQIEEDKIIAIRNYECSTPCSAFVGYTSQITQDEIDKQRISSSIDVSVKNQRGRSGIEEYYDQLLNGKNGFIEFEVSAQGAIQKELSTALPEPGHSIITTIDKKLQQFSYQTLAKKVQEVGATGGAVIVQNPKTGEILSIVTYPTYDNNIFTGQSNSNKINELFQDSSTPLLNRSIAGQYPPGSTYKIISSIAPLQENTMKKSDTIADTGKIELSGTTFNNWYFTSYGKTDGNVNVVEALKRSNDIYYYRTSLDLGIDKLEEWSRTFGLGVPTGVDIIGEAKGLVPNPRWKEEVIKEQWYPGNTVNMSIGQGDLLATPIQVNTYLNVIANKGILIVPSIVKEVQDANGNKVCEKNFNTNKWEGDVCNYLNNELKSPRELPINKEHIKTVEEGLIAANSRGGTATPFFDYTIKTAGKTGTSESVPGKEPHAWYSVYAPVNDPQISITVLVEFGGQGSSVAAPVAKDILDYYFF